MCIRDRSIGGVRGFEIGMGFGIAEKKGSEVNDVMTGKKKGKVQFSSNNAGGMLGGITNGQDLILRFALKPTSSISKPQKSINKSGKARNLRVRGRHDPCLCPRAVPIAEAMVNLVLIDAMFENKLSKIENKAKESNSVKCIWGDAFENIKSVQDSKYDKIFVDLNDDQFCIDLAAKNIDQIIRVLKPSGVVTAQVGSQDKRPKQVENWLNVLNRNFGNATLDRVYIPSFDSSWNFYSSVNHLSLIHI